MKDIQHFNHEQHGFKMILGTKKKNYKPTLQNYLDAAVDLARRKDEQDGKEFSKKFIFLMAKVLASRIEKRLSYEDLQGILNVMFSLTDMMAVLTPTEFMQLFPIPKEYDGNKYGMKDYFSTIEYVKGFPQDEPIGEENILDFLMGYYNPDILKFEVGMLSIISGIRRMDGQMGIMEEFAAENGIPAYSFYEKEGIMVNRQTGEVTKVRKPKMRIPKYMNVMEGGL